MNRLLTASEVVINSPVRRDYPLGYIEQHITRIEEVTFRKWLGYDFYKELIDDLNDIAASETYISSQVYSVNDIVELDGVYYKSLANTNTDKPIRSVKWQKINKFSKENFNLLWDNYLKYYLSYAVLMTSVTYSNNQVGANGMVNLGQDSTAAMGASKERQDHYKVELKNDMSSYYEMMIEFINETDTSDFDNCYLRRNGKCFHYTSLVRTTNRRIMFRDNGSYEEYCW